jgi:hypothetical protein
MFRSTASYFLASSRNFRPNIWAHSPTAAMLFANDEQRVTNPPSSSLTSAPSRPTSGPPRSSATKRCETRWRNSAIASVLELRYGLGGEHPRTLDEVGRTFSVTREWIRQIESQSLKKSFSTSAKPEAARHSRPLPAPRFANLWRHAWKLAEVILNASFPPVKFNYTLDLGDDWAHAREVVASDDPPDVSRARGRACAPACRSPSSAGARSPDQYGRPRDDDQT